MREESLNGGVSATESRMKKLTWITASLAATVLALSACGGKGGESGGGGSESAGGEPAFVITDKAEWDALADAGKTSFENACDTCHPGGDADLGPKLIGHAEPSKKMIRQIRKGSGRMAPIGPDKLPEAEMKGLIVYLATIDAVGDVQEPK